MKDVVLWKTKTKVGDYSSLGDYIFELEEKLPIKEFEKLDITAEDVKEILPYMVEHLERLQRRGL